MLKNLIYTGIGSRECPDWVIETMVYLAEFLGKKGLTLRSGGADGADLAFEKGCDNVNGKKEIYIPWSGFNGSNSKLVLNNPKAIELAKEFHPAFNRLSSGAIKLQARNSHQVLGLNLNTPTDFVICYTEGGTGKGGTGQAIRMANKYNVPVFDFGKYNSAKNSYIAFNEFYRTIIIKNKQVS